MALSAKTLDKLRKNPHYKISKYQLGDNKEENEDTMVAIGKPPIHSTQIPKHPTGPIRVVNNENKAH